jgi:regulator of protease activity HflC (stomatin/prohibitin superfamily)
LELDFQSKSTKSEASIRNDTGSKESPRRQGIGLGWFSAFSLATAAALGISLHDSQLLFAVIAAFTSWCLIVCLIEYLSSRFKFSIRRTSLAQTQQWVLLIAAGGLFSRLVWIIREPYRSLSLEDPTTLRLAAVLYLAFGCGIYFFAHFTRAVADRLKEAISGQTLTLAHLTAGFYLAAAGIIVLFLSTGQDFAFWLGWSLFYLMLILVLEPFFRLSVRFYKPKSLRGILEPAGHSLLLEALWGRGQNLKGALQTFERIFGMKLTGWWPVRSLQKKVGLIALGAVLLGWLSTCLTAVPIGCRGIQVFTGHYQQTPLTPGLHFTLPWPAEYVIIVETERVRQISLGFDKDLGGTVLWNEPHVAGEKNLLVGNGEALLTINVPVLYRVKDPVAWALTTADPEQALADLAEREILQTMGAQESFNLMLRDRGANAAAMAKRLQRELDHLNLGVELIFVGLQDIHPPVSVAFAYQDVVSAQEFRLPMHSPQKTGINWLVRFSKARFAGLWPA